MNFIVVTLISGATFAVGSHLFSLWQVARLRRSGVYPQAGNATMADVMRLKNRGLSVWAIRCYREIHCCSLREAKEGVDRLPISHEESSS